MKSTFLIVFGIFFTYLAIYGRIANVLMALVGPQNMESVSVTGLSSGSTPTHAPTNQVLGAHLGIE